MALLRDFEIPGTGVVVPNAYHIITNVKTEKRLQDIPPPPDPSQENGLTAGDLGDEVHWKAGYVGSIAILVYASQEARQNGKEAIGAFAEGGSDAGTVDLFVDNGKFGIKFMIDTESSDSILTQAYNHLKSTGYYSGSTEV